MEEVRKLHTFEIEILEYHSFPFGALSLKQQFIKGDIPTEEELEKLQTYLEYQFRTLPWLIDKKLPLLQLVVVRGT